MHEGEAHHDRRIDRRGRGRARSERRREAEMGPPSCTCCSGWADERRGRRLGRAGQRRHAADARRARAFGAEGIGLCRTEHQFLAADRLPLLQRHDPGRRPGGRGRGARPSSSEVQRDDFAELLAAMDGLPVTVRLLDPPLHEFLPDLPPSSVADAAGELDGGGRELLAAARPLARAQPDAGCAGRAPGRCCKPALYRMQVRALLAAPPSTGDRGRRRSPSAGARPAGVSAGRAGPGPRLDRRRDRRVRPSARPARRSRSAP